MRALSEDVKLTVVSGYASAAQTDVTSTGVDMTDWDGVLFLTSYGTAAADNLIHVEQSSDNGSSDTYADLEGGEIDLGGASDEDQWVDVFRPKERYVRCIAQRGTSSTLETIWAIQYRGRSLPADNTTAGTIYGKTIISPDEGTK